MAGPESSPFTVAESAWILIELIRVAAVLRDEGLCVGPIRAPDLQVVPSGLHRYEQVTVWRELRQRVGGFLHRFFGHDKTCHETGLSRRTLRVLMRDFAGRDGAAFLVEAYDDTLEETVRTNAGGASSQVGLEESLVIHLAMRISVTAPKGTGQQNGVGV